MKIPALIGIPIYILVVLLILSAVPKEETGSIVSFLVALGILGIALWRTLSVRNQGNKKI